MKAIDLSWVREYPDSDYLFGYFSILFIYCHSLYHRYIFACQFLLKVIQLLINDEKRHHLDSPIRAWPYNYIRQSGEETVIYGSQDSSTEAMTYARVFRSSRLNLSTRMVVLFHRPDSISMYARPGKTLLKQTLALARSPRLLASSPRA